MNSSVSQTYNSFPHETGTAAEYIRTCTRLSLDKKKSVNIRSLYTKKGTYEVNCLNLFVF